MSVNNKKSPTKVRYTFIAFRPSTRLLEARIRRAASKNGLSISGVVQACVIAHLPSLEGAERKN